MGIVTFEGAFPPQQPRVVTYEVVRPQKYGLLDLTFCGNTIRGLQTHWVTSDEGGQGSTELCFLDDGQCFNHDEPMEWAGFVQVWLHKKSKKAILRLAPKDVAVLLATLGVDVAWAGRRVTITAVNNGDGRTIHVKIPDTTAGAVRLEPWDMTRSICQLFGVDRLPQKPATDGDVERARGE